MSGSYSLLGQMRDRPYALGERGPGSTVPTMPLLSGQDAFDSLVGYFPKRRMDSQLNPHTHPMGGGGRATNKPATKVAGLHALRRACLKQAAVQAVFDDPARFEQEHPLVAGFLVKCSEAELDDTQIDRAISMACSVSPVLREAFEKTAFGGFSGLPGTNGLSKPPATQMPTPPPKPTAPQVSPTWAGLKGAGKGAGNVLSGVYGAVKGVPGAALTGLSGVGTGLGYASDALGATSNAGPAMGGLTKDLAQSTASSLGDVVRPFQPQGAMGPSYNSQNKARQQAEMRSRGENISAGVTGLADTVAETATGLVLPYTGPAKAIGAAMKPGMQAAGQLAGKIPGAAAVAPKLRAAGNFADDTLMNIPSGMAKAHQMASSGTPIAAGNLAKTTAGLGAVVGREVLQNDALVGGMNKAQGQPVGDGTVTGAVADRVGGQQQALAPPANDPLQMDNMQQFIAKAPEQAKELADQVSQQLQELSKSAGGQVQTAVKSVTQTGELPPPMKETGIKSLAEDFSMENAMKHWDSMDAGQKIMLGLGLGTTVVSLISAMTSEDGGIMPWLMSILGIGAAAMPLAQSGALGEGAQGVAGQVGDMAGQAKDKIMGLFGAQQDPQQTAKDQLTGKDLPPDKIQQFAGKALGVAVDNMPANVVAPLLGHAATMNKGMAEDLDAAAGVGGLANDFKSLLGDVTGITKGKFAKYGISDTQIPKVLDAWRIYRQAKPAG